MRNGLTIDPGVAFAAFAATIVVGSLFVLALFATPTNSQTRACGPRDRFVITLAEKYGEQQRGVGLASETQVVEFWRNEATGTFTVFATYPNGIACILAAGGGWTPREEVALKKGDKL